MVSYTVDNCFDGKSIEIVSSESFTEQQNSYSLHSPCSRAVSGWLNGVLISALIIGFIFLLLIYLVCRCENSQEKQLERPDQPNEG